MGVQGVAGDVGAANASTTDADGYLAVLPSMVDSDVETDEYDNEDDVDSTEECDV